MRKLSIAFGFILGTLVPAQFMRAGAPPAFGGGILGQVKGAGGVVQMGASVLLYDRYDQVVRRALTTAEGKFAFDQLLPDLYSIRVTLASFVPALRRNIAVAAGTENLLQINLSSLFSTVDLVSSGPSRGTLMTDDWKWVLRSSQATRPVLRFLPAASTSRPQPASMFSNTTGILRLSAGDGDSFLAGSDQAMGTAFALATSVFGGSRLQFSGNVGYVGNSALPTAGFSTSYSSTPDGSGPEATLTVRQIYLSGRGAAWGPDNGPALRTASLGMRDRVDLADNLRLEYGFTMESVSFIERLNYVSPFARATYDLGHQGSLRFGYSSGAPPTELTTHSDTPETGGEALNQDLTALAMLPRVSLADDHVRVQRTQNFEMGYQRVAGSRTYTAAVYSESVANAAFNVSGAQDFLPASDSMPDLGTNSRIFNIGDYSRVGYTAAVKQSLSQHAEASIAAGRTGALLADAANLATNDANAIRALIHQEQRPWLTASVATTIHGSGTHIVSSYGWTEAGALMPDHYFMTGDIGQVTGWNVRVRQPLPCSRALGGRLEATAELRNMLAQGYLPLDVAGRKALLTNTPRAVRGGLAFIF